MTRMRRPTSTPSRIGEAPRRSPIAPDVPIPRDGESVMWSAHLRADIPEYVSEQLREAAHRQRCSVVSLLLRLMEAHRTREGERLFFVREEDLVSDRRRAPARSDRS